MPFRRWIEAQAAALGFDRVRVATAAPLDMRGFDLMLAEGRHADLDWLAESRELRADARRLLPSCESVIVFSFSHGGGVPPDPGGRTGRVARYAWGGDYHNHVLKRLRRIQRAMRTAWPGVESYSAVDSRPVFERAWAAQAGLGWAAKNACQVIPGVGSWFFLGVLFVSHPMAPDAPMTDHCGRCRRCIDTCPTGALVGDGRLDARRCLSYWTIEADTPIPEALRSQLGRWVFGCDDCQDPCPHVRDPEVDPTLRPRHAWLDLDALLDTPDERLLERFVGSPIRRAAPHRLKRNAAIVLGNLGDRDARPVLERARAGHPLVAEAAGWALDRLA